MTVIIKPSDLFYKYVRKKVTRGSKKFIGKPDQTLFDRDDQYDVIPMFEAVMNELRLVDGEILEKLEEIMIFHMPSFIATREQVFDFLVETLRERHG